MEKNRRAISIEMANRLAKMTSNEAIVMELYDFVVEELGNALDSFDMEPALEGLATGLGIVYRVWVIEFEISNGGFPLVFENKSIVMPKAAVANLKLLEQETRSFLLEKAIDLEIRDSPPVDDKTWRHMDIAYGAIQSYNPVEEILGNFFRNNTEQFIDK